MSQENVELVRGLFTAAAGMDKQALLAALPEVIAQVCEPDIEWVEPQRVDARVYRGHEGVLLTFRDGKILRYREFYDEPAALEAAGL